MTHPSHYCSEIICSLLQVYPCMLGP